MTLRQAVYLVRTGKSRSMLGAINGLVGCPVGGWAQTQQAKREIVEALPFRSERDFDACDLIDALCTEDAAGRYRWRA